MKRPEWMDSPIWVSMRTREEKAQDEKEEREKDAHESGACDPDFCFWCIEAREKELEE